MSSGRRLLVVVSLSTLVLSGTVLYKYNNLPTSPGMTETEEVIRGGSARDSDVTMSAGDMDTNTVTHDTPSSTEQKSQHTNLTTDRELGVVYDDGRLHNSQLTETVEASSEVTLSQELDRTAILTDPVRTELPPVSQSTETVEADSSKVTVSELLLKRAIHSPSTSSASQNVPAEPAQTAPAQQHDQGSVSAEQAQLMLADPAMQSQLQAITLQASQQVQALADSLHKAESEMQNQPH